MRYTEQFRILSHDTGHNGEVHPSALCRYLQETADAQMRTDGPTYAELLQQGYAFLLSRMHIKLYRPLHAYDRITVQTWGHTPPRGVSFERYYQVYCENERIADAGSVWALLNRHTGVLCRVGTVPLHYGEEAPLPLPLRFSMTKSPLENRGHRVVRYSDVDVNNHMNNTRYADMLCDYLPHIDALRLTDIQIHYVAEAPLGETLSVWCRDEAAEHGKVFFLETRRADGTCNVRARIETTPL